MPLGHPVLPGYSYGYRTKEHTNKIKLYDEDCLQTRSCLQPRGLDSKYHTQVMGDVTEHNKKQLGNKWYGVVGTIIKTTFEKIPPDAKTTKAIYVAFLSISGFKQAQINKITPIFI